MDIDEEKFREGDVSAKLYGYLNIPYKRFLLQGAKTASRSTSKDLRSLARYVSEKVKDDCYTILGPGTTLRAVAQELGVDKTLLGVDVIRARELIARDVNELDLLNIVNGNCCQIIVTVIGGQGFILGRGNQQLSPRVIRAVGLKNIIIVATTDKLVAINCPLRVDTGDYELDRELSGYRRVITGYGEESIWKIVM
jgi:predicted polyphosphate/ATP-dependent NAD kinase